MRSDYLKSCAAVGLLLLGSTPVLAQVNTDSEVATGSITILQPLTLDKISDLVFGSVIRPSTGTGTATLAASAAAQTVVGGGAFAVNPTLSRAAQFTATGEGAQFVNVSIPGTFSMTGPGAPLVVTTSTDLTNVAATQLGGSLGTLGTKSFFVGGSVSIPNAQVSGIYTGTFTVTVTYN